MSTNVERFWQMWNRIEAGAGKEIQATMRDLMRESPGNIGDIMIAIQRDLLRVGEAADMDQRCMHGLRAGYSLIGLGQGFLLGMRDAWLADAQEADASKN